MKLISRSVFLLFAVLCGILVKAQQISFPDSFALNRTEFSDSHVPISREILRDHGFTNISNPGIATDENIIDHLAGDLAAEEISRIYFGIYAQKMSPTKKDFSVVVMEFKSTEDLEKSLEIIDEIGLFMPVYLTKDHHLIAIRGENSSVIGKVANSYINNVGAKLYLPGQR